MRRELEPWEKSLLCQLWNRVEINLLDERAKRPEHCLRMVDRVLKEMQWECRPKLRPGRVTDPPKEWNGGASNGIENRKHRWTTR